MRLGEILKKRRIELGIPVAKFAIMCGVSNMYIWYVERGQRTPSYGLLEILCKNLKMDIKLVKQKIEGKKDE